MLTIGPKSRFDDEKVIAKGYQPLIGSALLLAPLLASFFFEAKYVAFACVGVALVILHEIGGRLHDLCIRTRRTNILLSADQPDE